MERHTDRLIYLDNAATTAVKPREVEEAVAEAIGSGRMGNADRGGLGSSLDASRTVYRTREAAASLFGCPWPEQTVFTANSTESLNIAIQGMLEPGDHVITTVMEHNSVLRPLHRMEDLGVRLTVLPLKPEGGWQIPAEEFEQAICPDTKMIVCTHASNLTGDMVDVEAVGRICRRHGLLFVLDASQTAGVFDIDMEKMGIDVVCFTGHKSLMGPQGTGGLCVRKGVEICPLLEGGTGIRTYDRRQPDRMPTALEAGTLNSHGLAGLLAALQWRKSQGKKVMEKELSLAARFYQGVRDLPGVTVYGNFENSLRAPIVTLNLYDYDSGAVGEELFLRFGIQTRTGGHCAPLYHLALGTEKQGAVRFSFSYYNTEEEADLAAAAVKTLAEEG